MDLTRLIHSIEGEVLLDNLSRSIYATDASVYQETPLAVVVPRNVEDLVKVVTFCNEHNISIIPRAGGTSLAGQCVGSGLVVDISKHFKKIWALDIEARTVWVQAGVIRDELNKYLEESGLHFGPNTSTANRAMIGGMVGNNSCGTSSIKYGATRDHVLEMKVILSDGSRAHFHPLTQDEIKQKSTNNSLEGRIIGHLSEMMQDPNLRESIDRNFPHPEVKRRNTGYALDALASNFDLTKLLTGSEGTLAFTSAVKLSLDPIPGKERVVICPHFNSVKEAMEAIPLIMSFEPDMCELMDKVILDCTKANKTQEKNRFFLDGDPKAVLMVQFNRETKEDLLKISQDCEHAIQEGSAAYSIPKVYAPDDKRVFELRAAGLGVLANLPGDAKAVACIEDTAVRIQDLADYISEFEETMKKFGQKAVFYAHAGAGEIHLRPILDLKKADDVRLFYDITLETAKLVKKYRGSLSGEHGDGRVRAEFIPLMVGNEMYAVFNDVKKLWDPKNIFNPGKIVNPAPMASSLRYEVGKIPPEPETIFRFHEAGGMIRSAEKCNGSGDCRKLSFSGGTMCPSYRATRDEKDSTRARANALRTFLSNPKESTKPFESEEIKEALDLCISCKACGTECPSNVDMTILKAEFLYQYHKTKPPSLRSRIFARINKLNALGYAFRPISNALLRSNLVKKTIGVATERTLPQLNKKSLKTIAKKFSRQQKYWVKEIYLFVDEFSNYNDESVGKKTLSLLDRLGYKINIVDHAESGRAAFSKGFLAHARQCADRNIEVFHPILSEDRPLIGIEPSAILSFRDEYPKIVSESLIGKAEDVAQYTFTIEEFLFQEVEKGRITAEHFDTKERKILVHGHCHQKALSSVDYTGHILSLPIGHQVEIIPSGCCGMAGSFGYEKEHYEVSMQIGRETLLPAILKSEIDHLIAASGTSCRHQIQDGTGRLSQHPVEILHDALL